MALFFYHLSFGPPIFKKTNIERHFFKGLTYFLILLYIIYDFLKNVLSGPCVTCSGRTQCALQCEVGPGTQVTAQGPGYAIVSHSPWPGLGGGRWNTC